MLGMLLGLLDQGMQYALRTASVQARMEAGADLPALDAALRRLIARAGPGVYPEPASLKGTGASLSMVTDVPGADGSPQAVDVTLFAAGGRVALRWRAHRHVERFGPPPLPTETVLLAGVQGLAIDYATPTGGWRPDWTAETLPALVRVRLVFADAARRWPPIIVAPRLEALGE